VVKKNIFLVVLFVVCGFFAPALVSAQGLGGLAKGTGQAAPPPACPTPVVDPSLWMKSVTAGFNYTEGNSNTSSINLNGKLARDYLGEAWRFEADYNYGNAAADGESRREETKNNTRGTAEYKHVLDEFLFWGAGSSIFHDDIADIRYRAILNPSLGAYVLKDEEKSLSLEVGPSYVWEKKGADTENYLAPRVADRFEWKISPTAKIFQWTEYLISAEDSSNYIANAEVGVEAALTSLINLVVLVRDNYVNQPAEDRKQNDIATITGLKVNL
jgi:putative salt-induced outer membrane protein YdiY